MRSDRSAGAKRCVDRRTSARRRPDQAGGGSIMPPGGSAPARATPSRGGTYEWMIERCGFVLPAVGGPPDGDGGDSPRRDRSARRFGVSTQQAMREGEGVFSVTVAMAPTGFAVWRLSVTFVNRLVSQTNSSSTRQRPARGRPRSDACFLCNTCLKSAPEGCGKRASSLLEGFHSLM